MQDEEREREIRGFSHNECKAEAGGGGGRRATRIYIYYYSEPILSYGSKSQQVDVIFTHGGGLSLSTHKSHTPKA